jgi:hypothetical protein
LLHERGAPGLEGWNTNQASPGGHRQHEEWTRAVKDRAPSGSTRARKGEGPEASRM